jgi:hypothetical protein
MYDTVQEKKAKASKAVGALKSAGQSILESGGGPGGAGSGKAEEKKKALGATQTAMK